MPSRTYIPRRIAILRCREIASLRPAFPSGGVSMTATEALNRTDGKRAGTAKHTDQVQQR